jgi:hypothetical protein
MVHFCDYAPLPPKGRGKPKGPEMRYVVVFEEVDGVLHAQVRTPGSSELVALFACSSFPGAVGPLRELLRLATKAAPRPLHAGAGRRRRGG